MKRLIKKSDAKFLSTQYIDGNLAVSAINNKYPEMTVENLKDDNGAKAYYGLFSDDGMYVAEIYCFNVLNRIKGVAVVAPINITSVIKYDVNTNFEIIPLMGETIAEIKSSFMGGLSLMNGNKITFNNSITDIKDAIKKQYEQKKQNG